LKNKQSNKSILLTVDVEDWFQVENFKEYIPFSSWNDRELRVDSNTHKLLDLLDSFSFGPKATFFVLGWISKKMPGLVREIRKRGHEVASHGVLHELPILQPLKELTKDLTDSREMLEDIIGAPVVGYRAPSFAINDDILKRIEDAGYLYDSSYNSFSMHGRYGTLKLSEKDRQGSAYQLSDHFFELPVSNLKLGQQIFPLGGGGYFRLFPFPLFRTGMKSVLKQTEAFVFYSHPWEFDSGQPRVNHATPGFRFRHYINLHRTEKKLKTLIETFSHCSFVTCNSYLNNNVLTLTP
jgi:polysaccharide deacetylase family protein (PEP-CTERM system associated)